MDLKIRSGTVGHNNKILVSDEKFSLGKNENVNLTVPAIKGHKYSKTNSLEPTCMKFLGLELAWSRPGKLTWFLTWC